MGNFLQFLRKFQIIYLKKRNALFRFAGTGREVLRLRSLMRASADRPNHIFFGAFIPIKFKAFPKTILTAKTKANRDLVKFLSSLMTRSFS